jgi:cellulose synthase/poly-beta-1,6-N-acetylglucosamine synthase-like glycosyltransferase
MMEILGTMLQAACIGLGIPVLVFVMQIALAGRQDRGHATSTPRPSHDLVAPPFAVLMPAHNEEAIISDTVRLLLPQLRQCDQLLVVADNCSDQTAALARAAGATVVERTNADLRGKGYALDHGVRHLAKAPPAVLVVVDADCQVQDGSLLRLAGEATRLGRPIQALYLMLPPDQATLKQRVAAWAWRLKNWARPKGWQRIGGPCQLMGTGMAFPWALMPKMDLANGHLVEDMKLGAELALSGHPPEFFQHAVVISQFPTSESAQQSQRTRWEHGHLSVMASLGPTLFFRAMKRFDIQAMAMALDLLVPPIALLATLLGVFGLASLMHLFAGGAAGPLIVMIALTFAFTLAVWRAWWGWGRDLVSGRELLGLPLYLLGKLPVYASFVARKQKEWVRTDRR